MFKNVFAAAAASVLALFSTSAFAQTCEIGFMDAGASVQEVVPAMNAQRATNGWSQAVTAGQVAEIASDVFVTNQNIPRTCQSALAESFLTTNGWSAGTPVGQLTGTLMLPNPNEVTVIAAPEPVVQPVAEEVAAPAQAEVVIEAAPVRTIPVRVANREVRVPAVVDNSANDAKFVTINRAITALEARTTLTREDANFLAELRGIEGLMSRLRNLQDGQQTAALPAETQELLGKLELWSSEAALIAELRTDVTELQGGLSSVWNWIIGIVAVIVLLAVWLIIVQFKKASRAEVREVKNNQADSAKDRKKVVIPDYLEKHLVTLAAGKWEEFDLVIEGENVRVKFTKCDSGKLGLKRPSVITDDITNQTQPMRIDDLEVTLLRHIGAGRLSAKTVGGEVLELTQKAA